jgi:hypothetical protein
VVLEICVQEVGVDGMDHVAGDEERVRVGPAEGTLDFAGVGKFLDDALHDAGEEITTRTLAEERADFFVVKERDHANLR